MASGTGWNFGMTEVVFGTRLDLDIFERKSTPCFA